VKITRGLRCWAFAAQAQTLAATTLCLTEGCNRPCGLASAQLDISWNNTEDMVSNGRVDGGNQAVMQRLTSTSPHFLQDLSPFPEHGWSDGVSIHLLPQMYNAANPGSLQ
jgi:hypothetical protein